MRARVTTEDDFQRALDADPEDWQTRLVFADWLDERGDERAEGYRALGRLRLCPFVENVGYWWTTLGRGLLPVSGVRANGCTLPVDWFALIELSPRSESFKPLGAGTRRAVEDAAAVAFSKLSVKRRAALLKSSGG